MPASRRLARFNRAVANRIVGRGLSMLPGFGAIVHRGRRSGREYRTPVKIFRTRDGYLISLPYGPESDWVRNVLAAGGCELLTRGHRTRLADPKVFAASAQAGQVKTVVPAPLRAMLGWFGVTDFIELRAVTDGVLSSGAGRFTW
jgi:deazaflavin-dependent oxidoreductase (nitroreductase family)